MINALAGLLFGMLSGDWVVRFALPIGWGFVACAYHRVNSTSERQLYVEEDRRRGRRSRASLRTYYWLKYRRAFLISLVFSLIGELLVQVS